MIGDQEEFPQLGLAPSAKEMADSGWVNLSRTAASPNSKLLRHCASSPDMRISRELPLLHEDVAEEDDFYEATEIHGGDYGDEAFTMISTGDTAPTGSRISFRDVILIQSNEKQDTDEDGKFSNSHSQSSSPSRPQIRPAKYVVVQSMTRCIKSTGDLQSLSLCDSEIVGETDAMDYYHRKALGAKGRVAGLRLRPDEAKRKEFTLIKKNMQRAGQS
jgi:hypothetical protein